MSLSEEVAKQLHRKIERINVLQKLVMQDRLNLKTKNLSSASPSSEDEIAAINEEVRKFLLDLLSRELGDAEDLADAAFEVFARLGIRMTTDKARALDALLDRMVTKASAPAPVVDAPTPEPAPAPATTLPRPTGQRVLSPVLQALKQAAGGEDEWAKLPPDERARRIKDLERSSAITYPVAK